LAAGIAISPAITRASGSGDKPAATSTANNDSTISAKATSEPVAASNTDSPAKPAAPSLESEFQELRDLIEAQSKQIQAQSEQLKEQQQQMQALENRLKTTAAANTTAATPASLTAAAPANAAIGSSSMSVPATAVMASAAVGPNGAAAAAKPQAAEPVDEPPSLKFKGITLTPGGYFAAETVWRERAVGSGINSAFNNVPLPGNNQDHITEFNASGRQSRIAMAASGKIKSATIGGYYEGDFLSAGVTSNDNQSNSYTFRQRQFWGQAKFNSGWTFTGGQMWSLVTETKTGTDNRSEATTQTIDAQYNVGFSWARQYGVRVSKNFSNKVWLAASVEGGQTTITAHGQANNFLAGSFGVTGGLYNPLANYAFVTAPDFIVKAAFQPTSKMHFEVFGALTTLRDRVFPCATVSATTACGGTTGPSAALAFNDTRNGGGIGANARARVFPHVDLGLHFFGGDGIGRYGSVGLAQATVRPDGTLAPIRNYQSLGTIEVFTNKLDVYMYVGDEYEARTAYGTSSANAVGYGSRFFNNSGCWTEPLPGAATSTATGVGGSAGFVPGSLSSCTNDTKHEMESTVGFWYRFYRGSHGTLQYGMQASYFLRYDWNGIGRTTGTIGTSGAPHGNDTMIFTSFRYVIP
jgi:hypothetical protein